MIEAALSAMAFLITLVSALGETRKKDVVGLKAITTLGWTLLTLSFLVLLLSVSKSLQASREQDDSARDRAIAKQAAHNEIPIALRNLAQAMPTFNYIPPLTTRPITQEDIKRGELPLNFGVPSTEDIDAARTRWIQSTKVSEFSDDIVQSRDRLQTATVRFLPYLTGETVARINKLVNHTAIKAYAINTKEMKDRTLERAMYDEREIHSFQQEAIALYCQLRSDPKVFGEQRSETAEERRLCPTLPR